MKNILTSLVFLIGFVSSIQAEENITQGLSISNVKAIVGKTIFREKGACVGYTIKNTSQYTYVTVKIAVIFLDHNGQPFYEDEHAPVLWMKDSFTNDPPLKPNYSKEVKPRCTTDGIELDRWAVGRVRLKIIKTKTLQEHEADKAKLEEYKEKARQFRSLLTDK